jgi:hypothetical protein
MMEAFIWGKSLMPETIRSAGFATRHIPFAWAPPEDNHKLR